MTSSSESHNQDAPAEEPPCAAARVFAIPELLEKILLHTRPLTLFALQRVNTAFLDTLKRKDLQRHMLLEPMQTPRMRLFQLVTILQSTQIQQALYPVNVHAVYPFGENLIISLHIVDFGSMRIGTGGRCGLFDYESPCKKGGSWKDIKVEHSNRPLQVHMGGRVAFTYEMSDPVVELRRMVEDCEAACLRPEVDRALRNFQIAIDSSKRRSGSATPCASN